MVTSEIHRLERMKETRSVEDGWKDMRERERESFRSLYDHRERDERERKTNEVEEWMWTDINETRGRKLIG